MVRSSANKIIELSRGVVRVKCYGESISWIGRGVLDKGSDVLRGANLAIVWTAAV